jgi:hypothetical protein
VAILLAGEVFYAVLGWFGLLRLGLTGHWDRLLWASFGVLAAFAVAWTTCRLQGTSSKRQSPVLPLRAPALCEALGWAVSARRRASAMFCQ